MKKYILFLPVVLMMLACSEKPGCNIEGHTSFNQYQKAYLMDLNLNLVDSVNLENGNFKFRKDENVTIPYAMIVQLQSNQTPDDLIEMPVFIENGTVTMEIADRVHLSGTALNEALQDFLKALQHCKNAIKAKENVTLEEVEATFSEFYKQQILANKNNALGKYIYQEYGENLNIRDKQQVEIQISN